jgi:hypothetical protein
MQAHRSLVDPAQILSAYAACSRATNRAALQHEELYTARVCMYIPNFGRLDRGLDGPRREPGRGCLRPRISSRAVKLPLSCRPERSGRLCFIPEGAGEDARQTASVFYLEGRRPEAQSYQKSVVMIFAEPGLPLITSVERMIATFLCSQAFGPYPSSFLSCSGSVRNSPAASVPK